MKFNHLVVLLSLLGKFDGSEDADVSTKESCFCALSGELDDCPCDALAVDQFNSYIKKPLTKLLEKDYFRYFQVDFNAPCKRGWDVQCSSPNCAVDTCNEEDVPESVRNSEETLLKASDGLLSSGLSKMIEVFPMFESFMLKVNDIIPWLNFWKTQEPKDCTKKDPYPEFHDVKKGDFCILDPLENPENCSYVDLILNPEKFTGYSGEASHKVWNTIYDEMCFHPETEDKTLYLNTDTAKSMCLEKRAFFKLVSGLHSSISVHLCSRYLLKEAGSNSKAIWGRNNEEFFRRFSSKSTNGEGPERLQNIYFLYLVELRALAKVSPLLGNQLKEMEKEASDKDFHANLEKLLNAFETFPSHFDETALFEEENSESIELQQQYREKFFEISELMNCLGCERCKVWGKLQITGIGTALKILLNPVEEIELKKHEIVALFNSFGRHSTSISELQDFREAELRIKKRNKEL